MHKKSELRSFIEQPPITAEEERFHDVPEDTSSENQEEHVEIEIKTLEGGYDGRKRDPKYARAETTCLWELSLLADHFHPAVALYANNVLQGKRVKQAPQLEAHTLSHFLDKFVYRNPKKLDTSSGLVRGKSIMQPSNEVGLMASVKGHAVTWQRVTGQGKPLNSEQFVKMDASKIAPEDVFFHHYFRTKKELDVAFDRRKHSEQKKKRNGVECDDDEEDIDKALNEAQHEVSDEGEEFDEDDVWNAMQQSMKGFQDMQVDEVSSADEDGSDDDEAFTRAMMDSDNEDDSDTSKVESTDERAQNSEDQSDSQEEKGSDVDDFMEDEDDLLPMPEQEDDEEEQEAASDKSRKRKRRKEMPLFASFDDYEDMLDRQ